MDSASVKFTTALAAFGISLSCFASAQSPVSPPAVTGESAQVKVINYMLSMVDFSRALKAQDRLNYCTLNYKHLDNSDYLAKLQFNQQPVNLVKLNHYKQVNGQCHTLHVTDANLADHGVLLEFFESKPVLLISEEPDFARMGGHVSLFKLNDKLAFTFNIPSIEMSGFDVNLSAPAQLIVEPYPESF